MAKKKQAAKSASKKSATPKAVKARPKTSASKKSVPAAIELPPVAVEPIDDLLAYLNETTEQVPPPQTRNAQLATPAVQRLAEALAQLIWDNRETQVAQRSFPNQSGSVKLTQLEKVLNFISRDYRPAQQLFDEWEQNRPDELRDADGLEFARLFLWLTLPIGIWDKFLEEDTGRASLGEVIAPWTFALPKVSPPRMAGVRGGVRNISSWYAEEIPTEATLTFYFDLLESFFASTPEQDQRRFFGELRGRADGWPRVAADLVDFVFKQFGTATPETQEKLFPRQWKFLQWYAQPFADAQPQPIWLGAIMQAHAQNLASTGDFVRWLFERQSSRYTHLRDALTHFASDGGQKVAPELLQVTRRISQYGLQQELNRTSDEPSEWTEIAQLAEVPAGLTTFTDLLRRRAAVPVKSDRAAVLDDLLFKTAPLETETHAQFSEAMEELVGQKVITRKQIPEFSFLYPAWIRHVAGTQDQPSAVIEAVIWLEHHIAGVNNTLAAALGFRRGADESFFGPWQRLLADRTELRDETGQPIADDQIYADQLFDLLWFDRVTEPFGPQGWDELLKFAKARHNASDYRKVVRICEARRGNLSRKELIDNVLKKHRQEDLKLLSLLAFDKKPAEDLSRRQQVIEEYGEFARRRRGYEDGDPEYTAYMMAQLQLTETALHDGVTG